MRRMRQKGHLRAPGSNITEEQIVKPRECTQNFQKSGEVGDTGTMDHQCASVGEGSAEANGAVARRPACAPRVSAFAGTQYDRTSRSGPPNTYNATSLLNCPHTSQYTRGSKY